MILIVVVASCAAMAQGTDAHWPTAAKNGFGTSTTLASKVWFTLADGVMTEVFYPTLDVPNVQTLQFQVATGAKIENEIDNTVPQLELPSSSSLTFRQINRAKTGAYTITKTYITDPQRSTVLIDVDFDTKTSAQLYVYYDPSLNNSGLHDTAWTLNDALMASDGDKASALVSSCGFVNATVHLAGTKTVTRSGNVVQLGALKKNHCTIALAFGSTAGEALTTARASLAKGFEATRRDYEAGWREYVSRLPRIAKHQRQFNMAAMVLKGLEDKTFRGAVIASPSSPWGGGTNANEPTISGYHAVWSRDLYHVATAFDALGDRAAANRLLDYLFKVQQKPDGSFPQNSWVDGRPIGNGVQMDQVGLPLVLAYQLGRNDRASWLKHIKPAADFIVQRGPRTGQDRWEEKPGYSPSSIAAQIAGLVCAAEIARVNDDRVAAKKYLDTADEWAGKIERWTVTKNADTPGYYLRITENDDPNDGAQMEINSSTRVVDERQILDAGFLELVRLGVKPPTNKLITESLKLIDRLIKVETPVGDAWYRYNHDAYGETPAGEKYDARNGVGRLWTLLTGERGEYELAAGDLASARKRLDALAGFANDGLMIPEQVWDRKESPGPGFRFGAGTGSATPLAWSMAQFIRLAMNIERGRNLETPQAVSRYFSAKAQRRKGRAFRFRRSSFAPLRLCGRTFSDEMTVPKNQNHGLIFAADLGGTHLRAATVDQKGRIHSRFKQNTPQVKDANAIVDAIVAAVREFERQDGGAEISAVSLVVPGTVKVEEGAVVKAPNLPCLDGFRLAAALTEQLGLPAILENDANAAAVGEMWQGAAVGCKTIICVTLGTGVGGGIILNGELWRGVDGAAAEIGHMCVDPFGGVACTCGSRGCLEVFASATAIVRMTREASPRYPDSILQGRGDRTAAMIFEAGKQGDELALEIFRRMGVYLGIGLANLINILNPEMIVIGGGVVNGWDLFEKHMHQQVEERAFPLLAARVKIVRAKCGDDAGLLGAARLALKD